MSAMQMISALTYLEEIPKTLIIIDTIVIPKITFPIIMVVNHEDLGVQVQVHLMGITQDSIIILTLTILGILNTTL